MIKVKMRVKGSDNIPTFLCPGCGREDIAYICMPEKCYTCGFKYDFFVSRLMAHIGERKFYHFKTKSSTIYKN
jgi:hypothetical protein